jgi:drug/metabolite transporter (DMT)-like permease
VTASSSLYTRTDNTRLGIAMILGSVALLSIMNVLVKVLTEDYPVNQVAFFRSAFALIPALIAVGLQHGWSDLRTAHPVGHVVRSLVGLSSMVLIFWSFRLLPLGEAIAMNFSAPLFLTALSVPLLGEKVGLHRWSAVLLGFVGVLIMVQPSPDALNLGAFVALGAALTQAFAMVAIRQLSRTEAPNTIVFYFTAICTGFIGLTLPFGWVTPTMDGLALLIATGLVGGCAQLCLTRAYSLAPAAVIAPFTYASLLWAVLFGWLIWQEVPTIHMMVGAAIVTASGLYILHRETRRGLPKSTPSVTPGGD